MSKISDKKPGNKAPQKIVQAPPSESTAVGTFNVRELTKTITGIPEKSRNMDLVATLNEMVGKLEGAQKRLEWSLAAERAASPILEVRSIDTVRSAVRKAAQAAKRLEKLTATELASIQTADANSYTIDINERASDAQTAVRARWKSFIDGRLNDYLQLLTAVRSAQLNGSDTLERSLTQLGTFKETPPSTAKETAAIREKLAAVRTSVEDLKLEGAPRDFVVAASQGRGDPKAFLNKDVVAFLNAHPSLWKLLRVSLS